MFPSRFVREAAECSTSSAGHIGSVCQTDADDAVGNPVYYDCGDPVHMCSHFHAFFLYDERDQHFFDNIRAYNAMFSMTSFGARIENMVSTGRGPYTFKVSGQISHWIGSLCPQPSERPSETLGLYNEYVRTFQNASEVAAHNNVPEYSVRLYSKSFDKRYGLPAPGTLGGIVVADDPNATDYDIIIHSKSSIPQRINNLHRSYMPLQYPLLFPYGEDSWSPSIRLEGNGHDGCRPLTFLVDVYLCIELNRLEYIRTHQNQLRSEYVGGIYDAISKGDSEDLYTIEFQKRGLPHCHTLIWVDPASTIKVAADIYNYITAELPDPEKETD
ncbi:hypothetical protein L1887_32218 [Cichorium endivia]|nr:hypothetical protein L1887_32218 [Cichorium endivia]